MEFHRLERSQVTITALTIQDDIILNNNFIQSDLGCLIGSNGRSLTVRYPELLLIGKRRI